MRAKIVILMVLVLLSACAPPSAVRIAEYEVSFQRQLCATLADGEQIEFIGFCSFGSETAACYRYQPSKSGEDYPGDWLFSSNAVTVRPGFCPAMSAPD